MITCKNKTTGRRNIKRQENNTDKKQNTRTSKKEVIFTGKITLEAKSRGKRENLPMLLTELEDMKPVMAMAWPRDFNWTRRHIKKRTKITNQPKEVKIITNLKKLFKTNRTIKET